MKVVLMGSLALASAAAAASVSVIPHTNLPADAPTVKFEELPSVGSVQSYSELGLTVTAPALSRSTFSTTPPMNTLTILAANQPSTLFSFNTPINQVSYTELVVLTLTVTLFTDALGTQPIGTFSTAHDRGPTYYRSFAFESDTPFRSFAFTAGLSGTNNPPSTFYVDDLRYAAVPEPMAIAAVGVVVAAAGLRRRRA